MGRVRGAVNARALSLARKAVDLRNCWRREAAAECLVEKQVELVSLKCKGKLTACNELIADRGPSREEAWPRFLVLASCGGSE